MIRVIDGFLKNVRDFELETTAQTLYLHFCDNMEFPGFDSIAEMLLHTDKKLLFDMYGDEKHPDIFDKAWNKAVNKALSEEAAHREANGFD